MKNINPLTTERIEPIVHSDFGINVTIHIGCTSEEEIYDHLTELRKQFKKAFNKDEDFQKQRFEDNNCYGIHDAIIVQEI